MIEGLRIELTAGELGHLLEDCVAHHRDVAADCDARRARLQAVTAPTPDDTEAQLASAWPPYLENLERRAERHRERAEALQFLRDHLVEHEVYRLGEEELELLRLWPQDTQVPAIATEAP